MSGGTPGDPVARLATEVASLRREVADLATKAADVEKLRGNVDELSEGVVDLASRVTRLVSSPDLSSQPRPYWLPALEGEALERAWRALAQWIEDVVVGRYQRSVKPCWYRHSLAVDILASCYLAWSAAYREDAVPTAPAEWHDRWFPHLMRLVDADTKACKARKHEVDEELTPSMHEPGELGEFIKASVQAASAR